MNAVWISSEEGLSSRMSRYSINVDDAHIQQVRASTIAMKSDVDRERTWLAAAKRPIQPPGQVWPLADRLVRAWDQRLQNVEQWYDQLAADLGALVADLGTVRGIHDLAEETASDLAGKVMD